MNVLIGSQKLDCDKLFASSVSLSVLLLVLCNWNCV